MDPASVAFRTGDKQGFSWDWDQPSADGHCFNLVDIGGVAPWAGTGPVGCGLSLQPTRQAGPGFESQLAFEVVGGDGDLGVVLDVPQFVPACHDVLLELAHLRVQAHASLYDCLP